MSTFLTKLNTLIDHEKDIQHLLTILRDHVSLHSLRQIVKREVAVMEADTVRSVYYESLKIDVLPNVLWQSIVEFVPDDKAVKSVCKTFKNSVDRNRINWMRAWRATAIPPPIFSDEKHSRNVFVVAPNRETLTPSEIQKGMKGPMRSLSAARAMMKSGDKVFLCEGTHQYFAEGESHDTMRNPMFDEIEIEGMGECHLILVEEDEFQIYGKLHLINIQVSHFPGSYQCVHVRDGGSLWMTECSFDGSVLELGDGSFVQCVRCAFSDVSDEMSINAEGKSTLRMIDCQIWKNRESDTRLMEEDDPLASTVSTRPKYMSGEKVELQLIGCTFTSRRIPPTYPPLTRLRALTEDSLVFYNRFFTTESSIEIVRDMYPRTIPPMFGWQYEPFLM